MAQRVITQLVSDLSGDEVTDGGGETINFTYRGQAYSIDLTDREAAGFDKSIAMYIEHATKAGGRSGSRSSRRAAAPLNGGSRSKDELANIRSWARENGHQVSERGRIAQAVVEAYHAAQG